MVKYILATNTFESTEVNTAILKNFTTVLSQVSANAVPNSLQSTNYIRTAAALAQLTPDTGIIYDAETLYQLVNVTRNSVSRVPDTAALKQIQDLLDFYNAMPELGLSLYVEGTSRRRLLQDPQDREETVRTVWLDIYETMKEQVIVTAQKTTACGAVDDFETGNATAARSLRWKNLVGTRQENGSTIGPEVDREKLMPTSFKIGHICNPEQGLNLTLGVGEEASSFEWCKEIFRDEIRELHFSIVTTPDYVFLSRVQEGRRVLTKGLTTVLVSQIRNNNTLEDVAEKIENCYKIVTTIPRDALNASRVEDDDAEARTPRGLFFQDPKLYEDTDVYVGELYKPDFEGVSRTETEVPENANRAILTLTADKTGIIAVATRFDWAGAFLNLYGIQIGAIMVLGILLLVLLMIIVAVLSSWLVTTRCIQTAYIPPAEEEDEQVFVERDIYGRNAPGLLFEDDDEMVQEIQQGLAEAEGSDLEQPQASVAMQESSVEQPEPSILPSNDIQQVQSGQFSSVDET